MRGGFESNRVTNIPCPAQISNTISIKFKRPIIYINFGFIFGQMFNYFSLLDDKKKIFKLIYFTLAVVYKMFFCYYLAKSSITYEETVYREKTFLTK